MERIGVNGCSGLDEQLDLEPVQSGGFQHVLGTQTGIDPQTFATAAEVWNRQFAKA